MEIKLSPAQAAKREIVEQLKEKIKSCQSFVVLDYKGLTVAKDTEFRNELRKNGVEYKVYKNTLFRIALNELGYTEFDEALNGPSSFAFGIEDAVAPAKVAAESIKNVVCSTANSLMLLHATLWQKYQAEKFFSVCLFPYFPLQCVALQLR